LILAPTSYASSDWQVAEFVLDARYGDGEAVEAALATGIEATEHVF